MTLSRAGRSAALVVQGCEVARVVVADTYLRRLRGMLGHRVLPEALLLVPGGAVHGVGMTRSLDVAMLAPAEPDAHGSQVGTGPQTHVVLRTALLRPFGLALAPRGVRSVLEAPAGSFARWGLVTGDSVRLVPA